MYIKMAHSWPIFPLFLCFPSYLMKNFTKIYSVAGFEPWISGVRGNHPSISATNEQCFWPLQCSDGLLLTHRPVLAGSSPFLKDVLAELNGDDLTTLVLPEISRSVVETLLALLYTGKANVYKRLVKLKPRKPLSTR